jgi:hypothetical protein
VTIGWNPSFRYDNQFKNFAMALIELSQNRSQILIAAQANRAAGSGATTNPGDAVMPARQKSFKLVCAGAGPSRDRQATLTWIESRPCARALMTIETAEFVGSPDRSPTTGATTPILTWVNVGRMCNA